MFLWLAVLVLAVVASGQEMTPWGKPGCHLVGHTKVEKVPGCAPFESFTRGCRGFCESMAIPSTGDVPQPVTSLGQCCSIMDTEEEVRRVPCVDGIRNITFKVATSCSCYHCRKA